LKGAIIVKLNQNIAKLKLPENLKIGLMVKEYRNQHPNQDDQGCYSFELGQSPFPVPKTIQEAFKLASDENDYVQAEGLDLLREKIKSFNQAHYDLDIPIDRILIGPGSKAIIGILIQMLEGHFILPTPSWIGYIPQLNAYQKSYEYMRLSADDDYKVKPERLRKVLENIDGPSIFIINNPHNPTGAVYSKSELMALTEVFRDHDVTVISDEIYAMTTYEEGVFTSMAKIYPEKTFVTNGISKDRSAGGYRLGSLILPEEKSEKLFKIFKTYASILYSNVSTPIQVASMTAYDDHPQITSDMIDARAIHRMVGRYFSHYCNEIPGVHASTPEGGFYFVIDFNGLKDHLYNQGIHTSIDLSYAMFKEPYKVAIITGDAVGLDEDDFLVRVAFIDYDGQMILDAYRQDQPRGESEESRFILKHMSHMKKGFEMIKQFIFDLSHNNLNQ